MKHRVLILVENLPVPLDRRVWQEACALRDAGYEVCIVCPQMRGYVAPEEVIDGSDLPSLDQRGGRGLRRLLPRIHLGAVGRDAPRVEGVATAPVRRAPPV